ncbi:MAG: acyl--CoA ligase, partial [Deltaproteobacteria bacterium]|nr:acyl--CoA ligase [Deltaproteobacteria bacterium]
MKVIPDLLKHSARVYSERVAVVEGEKRIAYGTLFSMVEDLSSFLVSRGVVHGDRVAILLPNSLEFITSFFGVVNIGAIAVPLNTAYKEEELKFYISNSSPRIILTEEGLRPLAETSAHQTGASIAVIRGNTKDSSCFSNKVPSEINYGLLPDDEAIYLYSTGSTGKPKCVARTHLNLLALAENHTQTVGWTADDKILFVISLSHTYALGNFISGIKVGASLYVLSSFNRNKVIDLIEREAITVFPAVPFMLDVLAGTFLPNPRDFSSLKMVISAGSPLSKDVFYRFHEKFGIYPRQLYGSTETGVIAMNLSENIETNFDSVGQPVKNVEVKILRGDGMVARTGEGGEIAVKSTSMASGYRGLPEDTMSVFRDGYYHTGDLGTMDKEGYIRIIGRKKTFINISGNKVNPREVEDQISRHSKVKEVVVLGVSDSKGNEVVKAVIVPGSGLTVKEIYEFCEGKIADYKIPRKIEFRESIPKGPTG